MSNTCRISRRFLNGTFILIILNPPKAAKNTTCTAITFYELYYFVQGDVDYLVEGRHYRPTPHSMLLLAPNLFHGVRVNSEAPYRRFSFHFNPNCLSAERRELLLSLFPSPQEPEYSIYFEGLDQKQVPAFFEVLAECAHLKDEMQKALLPILAEALLSKLLMVCHTAPEHPTVLPPSRRSSAFWTI